MPNLRKPDVEKLNLANTTLLIKGFMEGEVRRGSSEKGTLDRPLAAPGRLSGRRPRDWVVMVVLCLQIRPAGFASEG